MEAPEKLEKNPFTNSNERIKKLENNLMRAKGALASAELRAEHETDLEEKFYWQAIAAGLIISIRKIEKELENVKLKHVF